MKESVIRTRILEVASRLFYEQGYNSTGINQIIQEAEIARGSLYNHFPSKRDLLTAYIQNSENLWFMGLDEFLKPIEDPKQKLLAMFDYRIDRQLRSKFGGCHFNKIGAEVSGDDLDAFVLVQHQKDRLKTYIMALLGLVTPVQPAAIGKEMLLDTLFLLMEGATVAASAYKDSQPLKDARKIAEILLG
ncbi:MAG: TetR/AcrR family transcriptional regulator [Dyadobacter sp.]|uniref:TetR/AcrR family transcriptional regulator n=1 Tax=Dyadobacter sp. TaxID=1914288 RepID=UPI00326458D5